MKSKELTVEDLRQKAAERESLIKENSDKLLGFQNQLRKCRDETENAQKAGNRKRYKELLAEQENITQEIIFCRGYVAPEVADPEELDACQDAYIERCNSTLRKKLIQLDAARKALKESTEDLAATQSGMFKDLEFLGKLSGLDEQGVYELKRRLATNEDAEKDIYFLVSVGQITKAESYYYKQVFIMREAVEKNETTAAAAYILKDPRARLVLAGGSPLENTGRGYITIS